MNIMYDSLTGNVARFIKKIPIEATQITPEMVIEEPFVLVTYTTGLGVVPAVTKEFLKKNHPNLIAIASSGNKNFGEYFAVSADLISAEYNVPIVLKFELSGTPTDAQKFMKGLDEIEAHRTKQ